MSNFQLLPYFVCFATVISLVKGSSAPFNNFENDLGDRRDGQLARTSRAIDIYRLSGEITPTAYVLRLVPDLSKFTFFGKVEISIRAKSTTNQISIHSKKLTIKSVNVQLKAGTPGTPISNRPNHEFDETNDLLIIKTAKTQPLIFGTEYTLIIEFEGEIGEKLEGFYRSSHVVDDKESWIATTHFEPIYARQAFPCFDEPRFRTPFTIYIARYASQLAVSNMASDSLLPADSISGADRIWEKFKTSPPMPTYLVSYMISDFSYVNNTKNIRVVARKNAIKTRQGLYSLNQSAKILQQLEKYFGITNKMTKMDIVAIPGFKSGGMENWGMVIVQERFVLTEESTSSAQHRQIITQLLSHEFAHQWFGNLVTPAWYNNLWLKEGFATYFEMFALAAIEPTWNLEQLFVIEYVQESLWMEVTTQRAMTTSIRKTYQIFDAFDIISYDKAGSIIRMFELMVSPNVFRRALNRFLSDGDKLYSGIVNDRILFDIFDAETQRSSTPLPPRTSASDVMKTWTENTGFPLITVTRSYENGKTKISQSPYRALAAPERLQDQRWIVPLTYTTSSLLQFSTTPTSWSFAGEPTELQETLSNTDWILFNLQHAGYYRVNYDIQNWNLLIDQLQKDHQKIPVLNRAQLISDAYALAYDEHLTYQVAIKLTEYLSKETDMIPWYAAIKAFNVLRLKSQSTTGDTFFKKYLYDLVKKSYETIGFEIKSTDSHLVKIVKPLYLMLACNLEIEDCIQKSLNKYKTNEADLTKIQPDVKRVVYCHALRKSADQSTVFNNLWTTYTKYDISYEKQQILTALTCATDEKVIKRILSKIIDPQNKEIRKQDRPFFLNSLISRPQAITASLKFIGERIATISQLNDNGVQLLKHLLDLIRYNVQTKDQIQQLKELETKFASLDQNKYAEITWNVKSLLFSSERTIKDDVEKLDRIHKEYLKSSETKSQTNIQRYVL